jgi:hypothetical protein
MVGEDSVTSTSRGTARGERAARPTCFQPGLAYFLSNNHHEVYP